MTKFTTRASAVLEAIGAPRPNWQSRAACTDAAPDLFDGLGRWPAAVQLCLSCPVRDSCLAVALAAGDHGVVRGGMLVTRSSRGVGVTPLICIGCRKAPVRTGAGGSPGKTCGRRCPGVVQPTQ